MRNLGQALEEKVEAVVENWINLVHQDREIESARKLAHKAVRNSLPEVLHELGSLLSSSQTGTSEKLENKSLYHGFIRAQQGYDTAEIVREYRLLRQVVFVALEPDLLTGSPSEILSAVRIIDNVLDEIITANLESYIDVRLTELRQMQGQLTLTNQELNRLIQSQKDNLSFMAHELKTPLNSIIGHSAMLLQKQRQQFKTKDTATSLDQLERVLRNGRRLLQIINDTLELSRYNNGQIQLNLVPTDISDLIQEVIEDGLEPLALQKGLVLNVDVSQAPNNILTDPLRIQQLVTNLVSNAIRYTDSGRIEVTCRQVGANRWEIAVTDTGIGISEEERLRIFDPYTQVSPQEKSQTGTGLGLAIVKRIITLMDGSIGVTSKVGEGSTFTVSLPLTKE
jgi:signal transduction histidine kinase